MLQHLQAFTETRIHLLVFSSYDTTACVHLCAYKQRRRGMVLTQQGVVPLLYIYMYIYNIIYVPLLIPCHQQPPDFKGCRLKYMGSLSFSSSENAPSHSRTLRSLHERCNDLCLIQLREYVHRSTYCWYHPLIQCKLESSLTSGHLSNLNYVPYTHNTTATLTLRRLLQTHRPKKN